MDATPWGRLLGAARDELGLTWNAAAELAGINSGTWQANELGYWTIEGRKVEAKQGGRAHTIAKMALVVGVKPDELAAAGRPDAAKVLDLMLAGQATTDVAGFHERWLREKRQQFSTQGAFLDYVLSVVEKGR